MVYNIKKDLFSLKNLIVYENNLITTLVVVIKWTIFDTPTCEKASCCNMFNLGTRRCKTGNFFIKHIQNVKFFNYAIYLWQFVNLFYIV